MADQHVQDIEGCQLTGSSEMYMGDGMHAKGGSPAMLYLLMRATLDKLIARKRGRFALLWP